MLQWKESENGAGVPIPIAVIEVTRVGIIAVHHLLDEAQTERAFRDQVARGLAENCRVL